MLVSLFWLGVLAGRFGVPLLYKGSRPDAVMVGLAALTTASIALLMLFGYAAANTVTADIGMGLLFLAGLGCSIYYPGVMTLVGKASRWRRARRSALPRPAAGSARSCFPSSCLRSRRTGASRPGSPPTAFSPPG